MLLSSKASRLTVMGFAGVVAGVLVGGCASTTKNAAGSTPAASQSPVSTTTPSTSPASPSAAPSKPNPGGPDRQPGPAPGRSGGGSGTGRCATGDLSGTFTAVPGSAGAGNIQYNLRLTNVSSSTCSVYGYPGMELLNSNQQPLPTKALWTAGGVPKQVVTLEPGGSAAATVRFSPDVPGSGEPQSGPCEPTAVYTEITPPNETTHLVVPLKPATPVCEHGTLIISPMIAGTAGPNQA